MKPTRALLVRLFAIAAAPQAASFLLLGLPALASARESLASALGVSPSGLWLPLLLGSLAAAAVALALAVLALARPLEELKRQIDAGSAAPRSRRCRIAELSTLERHLDANVVRAQEAQRQLEETEQELASTANSLAEARADNARYAAEIAALQAARKELLLENERLSASGQALREALDAERQSKVGAEVEKRAEEIYAQLERAVSASALRSIWLPALARELESPARIIQRSAASLSQNWRQSSLEQLEREVAAIASQTRIQLELIDAVLGEQDVTPLAKIAPPREAVGEMSAAPASELVAEEMPEILAEESPRQGAPTLIEVVEAAAAACGLPNGAVGFEAEMSEPLRSRAASDEALGELIAALVELAASQLEDGTVVVAVHTEDSALLFEVVAEGDFSVPAEPPDLVRSQRLALELETDLDVESSEGELRLAFRHEPAPTHR